MKAHYQPNPSTRFEVDGSTAKDVFKALAAVGETFGEKACGKCESANIYFVVRNVDGNDFFEMKCRDCNHKLSFGQNKTGGSLYPRRRFHKQHPLVKEKKVEEGKYMPDNGWEKGFSAVPTEED